MKKLLTIVLFAFFVFSITAQEQPSAKAVEVTNYKEVVSSILYPTQCKQNGIEGTVIVSLEIDNEGTLLNHEFIASPCPDLNKAINKVLPNLIFKPATDKDGVAISSKITMPVNFELTI